MNCYICATSREERPAVAVCPQCFIGVCLEHLRQGQQHPPGGLRYGCRHGLQTPVAGSSNGILRRFRRASR
jgi:hypothetical protein